MEFVIGMIVATILIAASVEFGRSMERNKVPRTPERPVPICHHCKSRLKPILVIKIDEYGRLRSPEDATWMCTGCDGPVYYKDAACSLEAGKPAPLTEL